MTALLLKNIISPEQPMFEMSLLQQKPQGPVRSPAEFWIVLLLNMSFCVVHGAGCKLWCQGVLNSALFQLSESHSFEVNPHLSSSSAPLAAAISTQSLTQSLQRLKEWAAALTDAKTHPGKDTQLSNIACFYVSDFIRELVSQQDEMTGWNVLEHIRAELLVARGRKNISLADSESIRQHWG